MDSETPQHVTNIENSQAKPSLSSSSSSAGSTNSDAHEARQIPPTKAAATTYMGKHRLTAAINFLNQQVQILQDELDELDTLGESSAVCQELISSIEPVPDALLPETRGPMDVGWERWFQGAQSSRSRRKWI
ncbi:hypothetical protein Leryth_010885 [Lithospermum erythrorhizon]|uniref:G protein gamma domain-containing protein n=1 Tax=Lithospermum erythrorhizon TaxID=34254 RepID=A0AAV3R8E3_LITER|nr:hypothetical protein Leryth_010885 [Lithospermum erythrorhizon]